MLRLVRFGAGAGIVEFCRGEVVLRGTLPPLETPFRLDQELGDVVLGSAGHADRGSDAALNKRADDLGAYRARLPRTSSETAREA